MLAVGADLGVVVAFGQLIKPHVLDELPMVNLHFSLLPRWRGAAPVERALLAGDRETGVCLMQLEEGLDTGPVYALRRSCRSAPRTTAAELRRRAGRGRHAAARRRAASGPRRAACRRTASRRTRRSSQPRSCRSTGLESPERDRPARAARRGVDDAARATAEDRRRRVDRSVDARARTCCTAIASAVCAS